MAAHDSVLDALMHVFDDESELQEVFMGSDSLPPVPAEQQPAAAVDTARIAVLPTDSLDDLKDVLLAVQ
ncbi:hypothetical protein COHA_003438 [Chlorella ohadii]|uniref:Uncharacterized protein n=1 Tax=Chlorella ohadii TaxID=2649997 RepID=A0AAD5H3H1_9CHLO|nr:hypothetical protein COHA_003438 [Chlorella ohadii]